MKKINILLCVILAFVMLLGLVSCGDKKTPDENLSEVNNSENNDKTVSDNQKNNEKESASDDNTESNNGNESTPVVDKKTDAEKQKFYEDLLKEKIGTLELNSKNMSAVMSSAQDDVSMNLEAYSNDSGDSLMKMISNNSASLAGYVIYSKNGEHFIEIFIPEMQDDDGNVSEQQHLYYKAIADESGSDGFEDFNSGIRLEDLESVTDNNGAYDSVTYIGTSEFHDKICDVVEIVAHEDSEASAPNIVNFYFVESTQKLYGCYSDANNETIDLWFADSVLIDVPEADWVEAEDQEIADAVMATFMLLLMPQNSNN